MKNLVGLILGGGRGTRLFPLTQFRSKPAVPFAGKYRLIDIPISNCLNSGIRRIFVLTQFLSVSLNRHLAQTYKFDAFDEGFVGILAAQQTLNESNWYQGTADAVRQHIRYIKQRGIEYVLILSGDQLYRMDYRDMLKTHCESGADVTIGTLPVKRESVSGFGIVRLADDGRVTDFVEKPQDDATIDRYRTAPGWLDAHGLPSGDREHLASMGIYLFNRDVLVDLLTSHDHTDFGKEIFPASIATHKVQAHLFDGYWEDVGTIRSFMAANLALAGSQPPLELDSDALRIFSHPRFLPPTRADSATISRSLIADGCTIGEAAVIENSVIGVRCRIGAGVTIRNSILMGADFYETVQDAPGSVPAIGIGDGTRIEGSIVDKNCRIGRNVRIVASPEITKTEDTDQAVLREGIVVIPKEATLPDNWQFSPASGN